MAFTTPCFIRKNTPELRKKLEELGYRLFPDRSAGEYLHTTLITINGFKHEYFYNVHNRGNYDIGIDCGTNEDLFLALAALRNDSDYMQWFINNSTGDFDLCEIEIAHVHYPRYDFNGYKGLFRKATVQELIEHFNNK